MQSEIPAPRAAQEIGNKIRAIDAELDRFENEREESVIKGMKAPGIAAVITKWGQDRSDARRNQLLDERAELVIELRRLLGD